MASHKAALKATKAFIDSKKYEDAVKEAQKVTDVEPHHYIGNVYLGLAFEKLNKNE